VPIVTINTLSVSVAVRGAALPHVATPWASLSGTRVESALQPTFSPVVVTTCPDFATPRGTTVMAQSLAVMANGLPIDIRKPYVHKTRVNAGGDGASGPHPEREPA
jgi:hypothetical protein